MGQPQLKRTVNSYPPNMLNLPQIPPSWREIDWQKLALWISVVAVGLGSWAIVYLLGVGLGNTIKQNFIEPKFEAHKQVMQSHRNEYLRYKSLNQLANWCLETYEIKEGEESLDYLDRCLKQRQKEYEKEQRLKKQLNSLLRKYNSPLGNSFTDSAVRVEKVSGIDGFAYFSVSVAGAESTFGKNFSRPYNVWGLGHCEGCLGSGFGSWLEAQMALAGLLKEHYGKDTLTVEDLPEINEWYAASPHWSNSVSFFWQEIDKLNQAP